MAMAMQQLQPISAAGLGSLSSSRNSCRSSCSADINKVDCVSGNGSASLVVISRLTRERVAPHLVVRVRARFAPSSAASEGCGRRICVAAAAVPAAASLFVGNVGSADALTSQDVADAFSTSIEGLFKSNFIEIRPYTAQRKK